MDPISIRTALAVLLSCLVLAIYGQSDAFSVSETFNKVGSFIASAAGVNKPVRLDVETERASKAVEHMAGVNVVDHSAEGLPKVRIGHRVADLFHGMHFDDILMDTPDEARPPGVVLFYDSNDAKCMREYQDLDFDYAAETKLPPRVRLFTARYDMYSAPRRAWYEFTPEMDLARRFNVDKCPQMVFIPRKCDGHTVWCEKGPDPTDSSLKLLGCEDFVESCTGTKKWDGQGSYVEWINSLVEKEGEPKIIPFLKTYSEQGKWLQKREYTTCTTHFRNTYMAQAFPAFTERGFKAMEIPKEFEEWLLDFHQRHESYRRTESWHAESTQLSFHEAKTSFIDLDRERHEKERMAVKHLQHIVEEWSGMGDLELTSFYGIREYHNGSWLRQHIDRIDTHVLSVTLSIDKRNTGPNAKPWPLQVTDWTGQQVAYDHPRGTMILYESSKLPHGRPTRNEGGIHLGAFLHFKPVNMNSKDAKKWDDIARRARKNVEIHQQHARFRETAVVEPVNPQFTSHGYGDESIWNVKENENGGQFKVEFRNDADRSLQVYWYHPSQPSPVHQGKVWPGAKFEINTYPGHTFFWAELDSDKPLPGGKFTVDPGQRVYRYNLGKDGKPAKASKWAKVVKEKIELEEK